MDTITRKVPFVAKTESDIPTYICDTLSRRSRYNDDPFIVANVSELQDIYQKWKTFFPSIQPFFALKCQDNFFSRSIFAANGAGFDVASLNEIENALDTGVSADHIIFAQPYKQMEHLTHALKKGILTVCDTVDELRKVGEVAEELTVKASVLIRILPVYDEKMNIGIPLSIKFGAPLSLLSELASVAIEYDIAVKGISFHVGSQCYALEAYTKTLQLARTWWNVLEGLGFTLSVLDIGGGFPHDIFENHIDMTNKVNLSIEKNFADIRDSIRVIAEPGRCMVSRSMSVVTQVLTVKLSNANTHSYVLNTGVYGALNTTLHDPSAKATKPYVILRTDKTTFNGASECRQFLKFDKSENDPKCRNIILYGPTCDSLDTLLPNYKIPVDLKRGDAIVFPNLGAYTTSLMTSFNGFDIPVIHYVYTDRHAETIQKILGV